MQFWDLKMSKIAVADCSGVGDVVMPKHSFMPRPSEDTRIPARHSINVNQSRSNAVDKRNSGCLVPVSMSALPPTADICGAIAHVCYGPIAYIVALIRTLRPLARLACWGW